MPDFSVFYSWQSDLPRKTTRDIIHGAAASAIAKLAGDATLVDAPRLDHDTLDVAGAPEIARTIFEKIDQAAMFIADVTFIAQSKLEDKNKKSKWLPNPNVLIELGYAASHLGYERVILVFNTAYGETGDLPFDLVHRRFPIKFKVESGSAKAAEEQAALANEIEEAIRASNAAHYRAAERCIERLDLASVQVCLQYGRQPYFSIKPYGNLNDRLARMDERDAIARLLDLGMIRANYNLAIGKYAYHWTYLGVKAIDQMGIPPLPAPQAAPTKVMEFPPIDAVLEAPGIEQSREDVIASYDPPAVPTEERPPE